MAVALEIKPTTTTPFTTYSISVDGGVIGEIAPGHRPNATYPERGPRSWGVNTDPENEPHIGTYLPSTFATPGGALIRLLEHRGFKITDDFLEASWALTLQAFPGCDRMF